VTGSPNPLAQLIGVALENLRLAAEEFPAVPGGLPLAPWSGSFASTPFPTDIAGKPLYDTVESAGEAGLYEALDADPELEVLWTGALAWQGQGIDAIARNRQTGGYVICEAKGTQHAIAASPLPYLRATRHKGRQLSWQWCWGSLVDMADFPTTALAFLCLLEPMLQSRCERLMTITQVERHGQGFRMLARRSHHEPELAQYAPLAATYDLVRQRHMWSAIPAGTRESVRMLAESISAAPAPTNRRAKKLGDNTLASDTATNEQKHHRRLALLRATRERFEALVLRGCEAPHKALFGNSPLAIVAGPAGSLLYAMARIPVTGSRASHRRITNRALWLAPEVQAAIAERFLAPTQRLDVAPRRNPRVIDTQTGTLIDKLEWHHSPNHIMSLSLIPQSVHRKTGLHAAGRGAYAMFSIPLARRKTE